MIFKTKTNSSTKWSKYRPLSCFAVICYKTSYVKKKQLFINIVVTILFVN